MQAAKPVCVCLLYDESFIQIIFLIQLDVNLDVKTRHYDSGVILRHKLWLPWSKLYMARIIRDIYVIINRQYVHIVQGSISIGLLSGMTEPISLQLLITSFQIMPSNLGTPDLEQV